MDKEELDDEIVEETTRWIEARSGNPEIEVNASLHSDGWDEIRVRKIARYEEREETDKSIYHLEDGETGKSDVEDLLQDLSEERPEIATDYSPDIEWGDQETQY